MVFSLSIWSRECQRSASTFAYAPNLVLATILMSWHLMGREPAT